MRLSELAGAFAAAGAEIGTAEAGGGDREISGGYTSDLLSDVMANAREGAVLVTIQAHRNTVAVASLVGIAAVLVCNGREIPEDMAAAARTEGIAILRTGLSQFEASGLIWSALRAAGK
jgi:hypothetical protein